MTNVRTYSELSALKTFEERFQYLRLNGFVGKETFGFDRFINQEFYSSREWKAARDFVIIRDAGCDLGVEGYEIQGRIIIHHMNPILPKDFETDINLLLDPEYLICTMHRTHNAIHYGDEDQLVKLSPERSRNDTCPWKR